MQAKIGRAIFLAFTIPGVLATPVSGAQSQRIRLDGVQGKGHLQRGGANDALRVLHKYAIPPTEALVRAAAEERKLQETLSLPREPYWDGYLVPMSIEGNPKKFFSSLDTGSPDFWLDSDLEPAADYGTQNIYNTSTGSIVRGETWNISYEGGGGASGLVYANKVSIGQATVTSQEIEVATAASGEAGFHIEDGVLGLAYDSGNTCRPKKCKTFFQNLAPSLEQPIFTAALGYFKPAAFTFGYIDKSLYTGGITYVPVNTSSPPGPYLPGRYGFYPGAYSFGTNTPVAGNLSQGDRMSIADTGTTWLFLPTQVVKDYYSHVKGAVINKNSGYWVYPCTSILPDFNVDIGGTVFTLPGSHLTLNPHSNGTCNGGIQSIPVPAFNTLNIFGMVFLANVYAIFDPYHAGGGRLGFAKQA